MSPTNNPLIKITAFFCLLSIFSGTSGYPAEEYQSYDEETLIEMVLSHLWSGAKYTVVSPETSFFGLDLEDKEESDKAKEYILKKLEGADPDLERHLERLFEVNRTSLKLRLKSNIEKGYLIDYDGEYRKYFEESGGGWDKWYADHPDADGTTRVSRPVYDARNGIILLFVGTQVDWKAGKGNVIVLKLQAGRLSELSRVLVWIS